MDNSTYLKTGRNRLLILARHLDSGNLAHKTFNFDFFNKINHGEKFQRNGCGTVGCAIGELPSLFPRHWKFESYTPNALFTPTVLDPVLRSKTSLSPWQAAAKFFDIDYQESHALFTPLVDRPWAKNTQLKGVATRKQVAASIRAFVTWKDNKIATSKNTQFAEV